MRKTFVLATVFILALLGPASFLAQEATPPDERPQDSSRSRDRAQSELQFTDVVEVQLVNVEAWVTDRDRRPVHGLTADDFEVFEDGKRVEITYFAEVQEDRPILKSYERPLDEPEPATPAVPKVDPNHLVIYFDELHLVPDSRIQAIEDIRDFLASEEIPPERVLILTQDRSLNTEATFGSSWVELDQTLERMAKDLPRGGIRASEKRLAIQNLQQDWEWARSLAQGDDPEGVCDVFRRRAIPQVEVYAEDARERIRVTLNHLAATASFLTGVPGVKTLLFVSDALERSPGTDLMAYIDDLCPIQQASSMFLLSDEMGRTFQSLTRHANANRVTIYAMQTEGLASGFLGAASQGATTGFRGSIDFDTAKRLSEREGLSVLASDTGGRAIFNRNAFGDDLEAMATEMSSYYSMAYEPRHGGDRGNHRIEVKVKDKSLNVRHRKGYLDKSADTQMTERLQGAVYLGLVDNPLDVRLGAGAVAPAEKRKMMTVPLRILVPSESVTFLPSSNGVTGQLSVQVSTRNTVNQKGIFDHRAYRIHWDTDSDQEFVVVSTDLVLPPGVHVVAVGVRDDATRVTSFVSTTVELHGEAPQ